MPTYNPIPDDHDARAWLNELIADHHPDLAEAKVTIALKFALADLDRNGMRKGPAIKHNGYGCHAIVKINGYENRVEGLSDATITLDGDEWPDWTEETSRAILDHELTHLTVVRDEDGAIRTDDGGRPKLKMRLHDIQVGWFAAIAERHGDDSMEIQQATEIRTKYGQLLWDFAEEHGRRGRKPKAAPALAVADVS